MATKSIYTRKLGEKIARGAKRAIRGKYHVIPVLSDKWAVVSDGSIKIMRSFQTQEEAVSFAKDLDNSSPVVEIAIHGKDGRIKATMKIEKNIQP